MSDLKRIIEFAAGGYDQHVAELKEWLSIPSVSTLPEHKADMQRAADWFARRLKALGFANVAIHPTAGHLVVFGESLGVPSKPTVLIYGHYDVQPADPLNEWVSPPFEPTIRDNNIYARGASDMKGQAHGVLKALEAWVKNGGLPVNIKVMLEGEEELGSPHLGAFITEHKAMLKSDLVLNVDSGILGPDLPALVYGLRGLAYFEVWIYGAKQDLHSGLFGGSILNPAQALCAIIAGMHDENGHITLPGFYDKVRQLTPAEREEIARLPGTDKEWQGLSGVPRLYGEKGFTTPERVGARPTLEVNGLVSGFTGDGIKTVLPAKAMAKISMRLVPYQDPVEVEKQLKEYMTKNAPPEITWQVKILGIAQPMIVERESAGMRAAASALKTTFGVPPVFKLEGGSVPVVSMVKAILGVDCVQMGFALPDDNFHGPNEKLHLPSYRRGIESYIRFFDAMAQ